MAEQPPPPQWAPPPQQPQWGAPPPGAWGQPGYAPPPPRPIGVTLSAALFLFFGVIAVLAALLLLLGGTALEGLTGGQGGGAFAGLGIVLAVVVGIFALLYLAVGIGLLRGRGWSRIVGIILAILGLLGGISALTGGGSGLVYGIVVTLIWAGVIFALYTAGPYFSYRRS